MGRLSGFPESAEYWHGRGDGPLSREERNENRRDRDGRKKHGKKQWRAMEEGRGKHLADIAMNRTIADANRVAGFAKDEWGMTMPCQCGKKARLVGGKVVYPHRKDLHKHKFYFCVSCERYVGCRPGTSIAYGSPADEETRAKRRAAAEGGKQ